MTHEGFDVEIHTNLNSKQMNDLKKKFTSETKHKDSSCFLILVISHGTADNFIQCCEGTKTWNIECLVTEVCDVRELDGRPKLFFIEACRGKESNFSNLVMTKSGSVPQQMGISLPRKQDVRRRNAIKYKVHNCSPCRSSWDSPQFPASSPTHQPEVQ